MQFFGITSEAIGNMFAYGMYIFIHDYGWVLFAFLAMYLIYQIYMHEILSHFIGSHQWVLLHIKVDKNNLQSTLAVEQIFAQMHAIQTNFTFADKYLEGKVDMWVSLEIVSLGGKISYFVYTP